MANRNSKIFQDTVTGNTISPQPLPYPLNFASPPGVEKEPNSTTVYGLPVADIQKAAEEPQTALVYGAPPTKFKKFFQAIRYCLSRRKKRETPIASVYASPPVRKRQPPIVAVYASPVVMKKPQPISWDPEETTQICTSCGRWYPASWASCPFCSGQNKKERKVVVMGSNHIVPEKIGEQGIQMCRLSAELEELLRRITYTLEEARYSIDDDVISACFDRYRSCKAELDQVSECLDLAGNRCLQISDTINTSVVYAAPSLSEMKPEDLII